jgi:hypothetical protein
MGESGVYASRGRLQNIDHAISVVIGPSDTFTEAWVVERKQEGVEISPFVWEKLKIHSSWIELMLRR